MMWVYLLEKVKRGVLCINLPPDLKKGFAESLFKIKKAHQTSLKDSNEQ